MRRQTHRSGLQANSSAVEGDTLAYKGQRLGIFVLRTLVMARKLSDAYSLTKERTSPHFQKLGGLRGALSHREEHIL